MKYPARGIPAVSHTMSSMPGLPFLKPRKPFHGGFWFFNAVPIGLGLFYLLIAYPRFCDDPSFILEHLLILALWIVNTMLLMAAVQGLLSRFTTGFSARWTALIPAASSYFLYVIYLGAVIGNIAWNAPATFNIVVRNFSGLFQIADTFMFSRAWIVALLAVPLALFIAFYQWVSGRFVLWIENAEEFLNLCLQERRYARIAFGIAAWALPMAVVFSAVPSVNGFGHFHHDPVVSFFSGEELLYPMTKERLSRVHEDEKAKLSTRRQKPGVHNLFLFVVDALRADHLPFYGYVRPVTPYLSSFFPSAHGRQVDLALSNGLETTTGILSLLTSKEPMDVSYLDYSLPDFLAREGFKASFILSGDQHWYNLNKYYNSAGYFVDGTLRPGPHGTNDDELVLNEINRLTPDDGGYHFFYIHLMSVHQFGYLQEKYFRYKPLLNFFGPEFRAHPTESPGETQALINMYDDRILQMDDLMKKILSLLRQKGYLRDYLGVFTADHGQLLGDHGKFGHGTYLLLGGIHIPLVFFGSNPLPPFPESRFCVQMDIAPTLSSLAKLEYPSIWQGQSLLKPRANPWSYHFSLLHRPGVEGAVVYYRPGQILKYSKILRMNHLDTSGEKLYDLEQDPLEKTDLMGKIGPNLLSEIRQQAREHLIND